MCIVIKTQISNLVRTTRFWNNHQQVRSKSKDWKANEFEKKILGAIKTTKNKEINID